MTTYYALILKANHSYIYARRQPYAYLHIFYILNVAYMTYLCQLCAICNHCYLYPHASFLYTYTTTGNTRNHQCSTYITINTIAAISLLTAYLSYARSFLHNKYLGEKAFLPKYVRPFYGPLEKILMAKNNPQ